MWLDFTGRREASRLSCLLSRQEVSRCWLLVACLMSQRHASVSQKRICSDSCTCCHTEAEAADQTFFHTQSLYTDTGPSGPGADPIMTGAWQGSCWVPNCYITGMIRPTTDIGHWWESLSLSQLGFETIMCNTFWSLSSWSFQGTSVFPSLLHLLLIIVNKSTLKDNIDLWFIKINCWAVPLTVFVLRHTCFSC